MTRVRMACKMSRYKKHTCFAGQTSRSWRRIKITWQDLQKQLKARCSDCWDSLKRNSNKITATMVCSWPLPQEKVDEALTQAAWRWNWERRWGVYQECYPLGALNPFNIKNQCDICYTSRAEARACGKQPPKSWEGWDFREKTTY